MSNSFKLCPTDFSRGSENFSRGASPPPGYRPAYISPLYLHAKWDLGILKIWGKILLCISPDYASSDFPLNHSVQNFVLLRTVFPTWISYVV